MTEVPDNLKAVFTTTLKQDAGFYLDVPLGFMETETLQPGKQYRVALLETSDAGAEKTVSNNSTESEQTPHDDRQRHRQQHRSGPPVEEGETRSVTIESLGDAGDGVAKVEGGYVVIVPDTEPGQQPTVRITDVKPNVAFATVVQE